MTLTASFIMLGWLACFVFTVLLIPREKRPMDASDLSLLLLMPVAPLSFVAMLIFQLVRLEEALLLKHCNNLYKRRTPPLGNNFMIKYHYLKVFHRLRIHDINKVKWR